MPLAVVACGSDDDEPSGSGGSGSGGTSGSAGTSGSGGAAGGGSGGTSGSSGSSGSAGTSGSGGMAGGGGGACDINDTTKNRIKVTADITADETWTSDNIYELEDVIYVTNGATLTIDPCTRIEGNKAPVGALVIARDSKIMADGTADEPILFTSKNAPGSRARGDWGGVILLGRAQNWKGDDVLIEGLEDTPDGKYGPGAGNQPNNADNSGVMRFVRIEFGGFELLQNNEINGLTMGSVGSGTTIENIMVANTLDDCFEWFGGTVDAKWLICNNAGDDMYDADQGYEGNVQFAFGRQVNPRSDDPRGFECDSDNGGATPPTKPNFSNVTLCGKNDHTDTTTGAVFREQLEGRFNNMIISGFNVGVDVRDDAGTPAAPKVELTGSVFFGNDANPHDASESDDDMGFDEGAWFNDGARMNSTTDPMIGDCQANPPAPFPASEITGVAPTAPLDASATYAGAVKDSTDNWMTGAWVDWAAN